jgi:hypothetical protein
MRLVALAGDEQPLLVSILIGTVWPEEAGADHRLSGHAGVDNMP